MVKAILINTLLFLSVIYAYSAEKWVFVSGDGVTNVYYDERSVIYDTNFNCYTVYFKYENLKSDTLSNGKVLTSQCFLYNYYCSTKRSLLLEIKEIYSDNTFEYLSPTKQTNYISANSPEVKVFESFCK
jgi:hypothetical protein